MKVPQTYADWSKSFELFRDGTNDEAVLIAMENGSIEWTSGVAERITQQLFETMETRLKRASQQMQTEFSRLDGQDITLVRALMNCRRRYALLIRLVKLSAFPANVNNTMYQNLHKFITDTQTSLEENAKKDRTGRLRLLIKNNSLLLFDRIDDVDDESSNETDAKKIGTPNTLKRRVIF